jgi:transcription initiation factor TFIIIB Brf1 subunit/transcription initiation factor TFIIB
MKEDEWQEHEVPNYEVPRPLAAKYSTERSVVKEAKKTVDQIGSKLCLSDSIIELAMEIFEKAESSRGATRKSILAASLYYACKFQKCDRELRVISTAACIRPKALNKATRVVQSILAKECGTMMFSQGQEALVGQYTSRLEGVDDVTCRKIASKARTMLEKDSGKRPRTIAARAIYSAIQDLGLDISKQVVAKASGVCINII